MAEIYLLILRQPGKHWHAQKSAFRPKAGQTSYSKRINERKAMETMKAKEREMKDEKEAERQVCSAVSATFSDLMVWD